MVGEIGKPHSMFLVFVLGRLRSLKHHALCEVSVTLFGIFAF
jgi:hypothetical protein